MGKDKGLIKYRGKPLVKYAIEVCEKFTDIIFISTNNKKYAAFGYPLVPDNFIEVGPIGGLEAALSNSQTEDNIICPCDMPNIHSEMFEKILQNTNGKPAAVIGNKEGKIIPVFGYYRKSILPVIQHQIKTGNYKLLSLLNELNAETVVIDSESFFANLNYPEDIK